MTRKSIDDDRISIVEKIEKRVSSYEKFEALIQLNLLESYFPFAYQSFYTQIGYNKNKRNFFTTDDFKFFVCENNFIGFINDIYHTHLSTEGIKIVSGRLQKVENFDDYINAISIFESCDPITDKHGNTKIKNAFSFGTKVLHFYNPEQNPILDSKVRNNLGIKGEMSKTLCIEFREAANMFAKKRSDYFDEFYKSKKIDPKLGERRMTNNFSTMEILDMALYEA